MKLKYRKKIHKNREEFFWLARIYTHDIRSTKKSDTRSTKTILYKRSTKTNNLIYAPPKTFLLMVNQNNMIEA